jgi:hypothetical protein
MRSARFSLVFSILLLSVPVWAQQTQQPQQTPPLTAARDPQAVAVVQAALAAFGGSAAAQSLQVLAQVQVPGASGSETSTLTWEVAGSEFRIALSDAGGSSVIVTGHGNPSAITNGNAEVVPKHVIEAMFIPAFAGAILAREFQSPNYFLRYRGVETLNGTPTTVVETMLTTAPNAPLTRQIWYFSNATRLPVRVIYRVPADQTPLAFMPEAVDLSNFTPVSGGLYPFSIGVSQQGKLVASITLQSVNPNANIPSTDFDPAGGAQ